MDLEQYHTSQSSWAYDTNVLQEARIKTSVRKGGVNEIFLGNFLYNVPIYLFIYQMDFELSYISKL
ncbi:hypothetical protein DICPUDRAFT_149982 [Dictyostelium purpureum]|uniref:Uncharacterized protein n=1 Tax=Dictyostelium purpureum TaxID=5786 RepID=F0ZF56_DICPU|nr:uncharacterized protein DICPUDRAFT_149982 [Dictyostelium purpureum]EGC37393.1 hypothetical protein DICPUDRAFT_149982 [Dictyostelium purpureum]|eukprot:XP_003286046.1 hypothetical protein DICPUDRAFT_149982 [Dictyostelium purpureum]